MVSAGLPMSCIDNEEVRKTDLMTADCGQSYIRTKPGGVKKPRLSHRTYVTIKLVPKLDKFIDDKNMHKMREMTKERDEGNGARAQDQGNDTTSTMI